MRTRLISLVLHATLSVVSAQAMAAELATQKSSDRGVTVAVTPQNVSAGAARWDFKVALDTHSADLSDDLVKSAVLLDGKGGQHAPVAWKGAAPGGHHRQGVLSFKPLGADVKNLELRIQRPGEPSPRVFRWQLK